MFWQPYRRYDPGMLASWYRRRYGSLFAVRLQMGHLTRKQIKTQSPKNSARAAFTCHVRHAPPGGSSPNSSSIECDAHSGCSATDLLDRRPRTWFGFGLGLGFGFAFGFGFGYRVRV